MRLESAMFSGREGINAHGQAISVVGDNIANVNTTAYKASRVEFADIFSEGSDGAQNQRIPTSGDGVQVKDVRQIFNNGPIESTDRELDVGIDGNGFFVVGSATDPFYTRAGNFSINEAGELVTPDGYPLLGFPAGTTTLGALNVNSANTSATATTEGAINGNLDPRLALVAAPENPASFSELGQSGAFTSSMRIFDSLGAGHDLNLYYFHTGVNEWNVRAYVDGADVGGTAGQPTLVGQTTLAFSENGVIPDASQAGSVIQAQNVAWAGGAAAGNFSIGLGDFTQYATLSSIRSNTQDGLALGTVTGYRISADGSVEAVVDSGDSQLIGTIQLMDFNNRDGLDRIGSNLYRDAGNAGARDPGTPGTSSLGQLQSGALERSTVDLSGQFVDLVLYQRGYQANSQTITAVNQLIQNTIALVR